MTKGTLADAIKSAHIFLERAKKVEFNSAGFTTSGPKLTGGLRRASMDLTRVSDRNEEILIKKENVRSGANICPIDLPTRKSRAPSSFDGVRKMMEPGFKSALCADGRRCNSCYSLRCACDCHIVRGSYE